MAAPISARATTRPAWRASSTAGALLVAASGVAFSTAGLFTRLVATDVWTMLFWRGVFGGLLILAVVAILSRGHIGSAIRAMGWGGLVSTLCSTGGTICFIIALRESTVAEVTIIYATAPFLAAAFAWAWFREAAGRVTLAASLLALIGVAVMGGAAAIDGHALGNLLALVMTALMALMMVVIRRHRHVSMLPAAGLSAFACAAIVLPLAQPWSVTGPEFGMLALFGITQFGLGLLLLTLGSRLIPAARASLLANLELPFAPLWVWLAFGELPTLLAGIGGAIVCAALLLDLAAARLRQ